METENPYSPPEKKRYPGQPPSWLRLVLAFLLFPVWFFIGGAISIGGSPLEAKIDILLFFVWLGYTALAISNVARASVRE